jgi:hypothetical protein
VPELRGNGELPSPDLHRAFTRRAATLHARLIARVRIHRGEISNEAGGQPELRSLMDGPTRPHAIGSGDGYGFPADRTVRLATEPAAHRAAVQTSVAPAP